MSKNMWKSNPQWFEHWFDQPEYHVLYGHRSQEEADGFVKKVMEESVLGYGVQRILDVGCGAGRHAIAMSAHGHDVIGLDLSKNNITTARSSQVSASGKIEFMVGDMRRVDDYFPRDSMDAVTMLFTSFGYFETDKEHIETLKSVRRIIKEKGTFILDFFNLDHVVEHLILEERITKEGVDFHIRRRIANGWIEKSIEFVDREGKTQNHMERVRAFTPSQLGDMVKQAGFHSQARFGNYDLQPLGKSSRRCIIVAQ